MEREVDWRSILEERTTEQTKLATKPGKNSSDKFRPGDKVILQETTGRKKQWIETGVIEQARNSDDGTSHSFIIKSRQRRAVLEKQAPHKAFQSYLPPLTKMTKQGQILHI